MKLEETCSGGGPVIAIPSELAQYWRGVSPPLGIKVPKGWQWGSGDIICDYDRACDEAEDVIPTAFGGVGWLTVENGIALILDAELMTEFLPLKEGGVILRNYPEQANDNQAAQVLFEKVPEESWQLLPQKLTLREGKLFIFDSAFEGAANPDEIEADDGVIIGMLEPGEYKVLVAEDDEVDFIYLVKI